VQYTSYAHTKSTLHSNRAPARGLPSIAINACSHDRFTLSTNARTSTKKGRARSQRLPSGHFTCPPKSDGWSAQPLIGRVLLWAVVSSRHRCCLSNHMCQDLKIPVHQDAAKKCGLTLWRILLEGQSNYLVNMGSCLISG
jgi:hypothetical protein